MARFIAEPDAGVLALVMEFTATALNPTQGLIKGQRLLSLLRTSPGTAGVLASYERLLAVVPWAVYDVRRAISPRADGKANHARSVRILDVGPVALMHARLCERAYLAGIAMTSVIRHFRTTPIPAPGYGAGNGCCPPAAHRPPSTS